MSDSHAGQFRAVRAQAGQLGDLLCREVGCYGVRLLDL